MSESKKLNNVVLTKQDEAFDGANYDYKTLRGNRRLRASDISVGYLRLV